jgi:hypothetical protein
MKDEELLKFSVEAKNRAADELSFKVFQLRKEGLSFQKIADKLGFKSASGAQYYQQRYFKTLWENKSEQKLRTTGEQT